MEEVGFPYFTTLRPFYFASNHLVMSLNRSTKPPKTNYVHPDALVDNIVPDDIGAVGGAVLVDRPSSGKEVIYLYGPELKTLEECWAIIKRVTGRDDIDTTPLSKEAFVEEVQKFVPAAFAHYLVNNQERLRHREVAYPDSVYVTGATNVKKYTGREPTKFEDYVAAHKAEWNAV